MFQKGALRIFQRPYALRRLVPCRAGSRMRRIDRGDRALDRRPQPGYLGPGNRSGATSLMLAPAASVSTKPVR